MNQIEARAELVKRLRSGLVVQTRKVLGRPDGSRCCLGVACDIAVEAGIATAVKRTVTPMDDGPDVHVGQVLYSYDGKLYTLPKSVREFFGFVTNGGSYTDIKGRKSLAFQNDNGLTFSEIADIIESNPEGLFRQS